MESESKGIMVMANALIQGNSGFIRGLKRTFQRQSGAKADTDHYWYTPIKEKSYDPSTVRAFQRSGQLQGMRGVSAKGRLSTN
jgi:hypothetical protein